MMYKYLLLGCSLAMFTTAAPARSDDVTIEELDGSHFQRTDIYKGKVWGAGTCTVSGSRVWTGACQMELFTLGALKRYDIYLHDEKTYYRVVQSDTGDTNLYVTRSDNRDIKTSVKQASDRDITFTMDDMAVHVVLPELKQRTDPGFSHESAYDDEQAYMIMARGQGNCELSGSRSFAGTCNVQVMARGMLDERYDIKLDDPDNSSFNILKLTDGSKRYVTAIDGKETPTTIEDIKTTRNITTESVITFGDDLKLHIGKRSF